MVEEKRAGRLLLPQPPREVHNPTSKGPEGMGCLGVVVEPTSLLSAPLLSSLMRLIATRRIRYAMIGWPISADSPIEVIHETGGSIAAMPGSDLHFPTLLMVSEQVPPREGMGCGQHLSRVKPG